MGGSDGRTVTRPLPSEMIASVSPADRERARAKISRKWAYLLCTTTYVPLVHADLEQPLREMANEMFDALAGECLELAERVGARLVELNCVDRRSLQITVDVLSGPLLAEGHPPERVTRLLGALAAGFADGLRQRTTEQQESMVRAVKAVAMKATNAAKAHQAEREAVTTELSLLRRQLSYQLLHDALTGLPNRQFFTTRLEEVLNSGCPTTLYRIELDGFAVLNDSIGCARTDTLLVQLAGRLRNAVTEEGAMLARLDRASFAVLHERCPEATREPTPPAELVDRLRRALAETTYVEDLGLALSASIGVAQSPPHRAKPTEFLRAADLALRLAKDQGPGQWRLLLPEECAANRRLLRLAAIMPGAVETGGLAVGYRLRVDLADQQPVAVDAYPRWDEAGLAGQECAALAEQTGLSPQLGQWLLRAACEQMSSWGTGLPLSLNLSTNQSAAPDLVEEVLDTLADLSLPPGRLRLAMPAAEVFNGRPQALDNLTALAKAGVRTAVHEFCGNPSDVVRLPDLPLRMVSLAPRLIAQARSIGKRALVSQAFASLTALVHEAGATVSVDDLRTEPEVAWWRRVGADTASGPLFPVQGHP
jgi:diguanylate cyclase (GGDEF)-like protein